MSDLRALDACRPTRPVCLHPELSTVTTPMRADIWEQALKTFPDQGFADYIVRGIKEGFRIGFNYRLSLRSRARNMSSAKDNPLVVEAYINEERNAKRLLPVRPEHHLPRSSCQISSFGVIPKRYQPGKWRLIVDLSSPDDASVNDGIDPHLCSLAYPSVHDAAKLVRASGKGTLLAKLDLKSAYRIVPVHPQDRPLLAVQWDGEVLIDSALPFGLRSAPKIFTAIADALMWVMQQRGVTQVLHYLDDFLFVGKPDSHECARNLAIALEVCSDLGVPVAPQKIEGPDTCLSFLGIQVDSVTSQLSLPHLKLSRLRDEIHKWYNRKKCTKQELQSLLGQLNHAASVIGPGRTFMRDLIDHLKTAAAPHHHIRLNSFARADIAWWAVFMESWNGISYLPGRPPLVHIYSDASGSWGAGTFWGCHWLQLQWPLSWLSENIATKELVPIVAAVAVWGRRWSGSPVCCHCDNMAVVAAINAGRARYPPVNRLLRCLFFFTAHYKLSLSAVHIPGAANVIADAISRNYPLSPFPQLTSHPAIIPPTLARLLLDTSLHWSSPSWKPLFKYCLEKV